MKEKVQSCTSEGTDRVTS